MFLYDYFILLLFIIKISFYIFYLINFVLRILKYENKNLIRITRDLDIVFNVIFNTSMAVLLMYLFYPFGKPMVIDNSMRLLLFLYSFVLLLSNFSNYFNEDKVIHMIRKYLYGES